MIPIELERMATLYSDPLREANPTIPWNGCGDCDFQKPCTELSEGCNYTFTLNTEYTERTDDVEETGSSDD
jgi:hypothetical protein